jgi:hypothetical protein
MISRLAALRDVSRLRFQGQGDEVLDLVIADPARRPGAGRIAQAFQAMG